MSETKDTFTRAFELENRKTTLILHQQSIGDVSCVVWDAALVLSKYLDICSGDDKFGRDWLSHKQIVELGAGIGCVGMTAACLGAQVISTDLESTLPMLRKNIELNKDEWSKFGGSIHAQVLEWGKEIPSDLSPDIVLLADCVYYTESIEPLLETLSILCRRKPNAYAIMSQEERDTPGQLPVLEKFTIEVKNRFNVQRIPMSDQHPAYSSEDIHLLKLTLKK